MSLPVFNAIKSFSLSVTKGQVS